MSPSWGYLRAMPARGRAAMQRGNCTLRIRRTQVGSYIHIQIAVRIIVPIVNGIHIQCPMNQAIPSAINIVYPANVKSNQLISCLPIRSPVGLSGGNIVNAILCIAASYQSITRFIKRDLIRTIRHAICAAQSEFSSAIHLLVQDKRVQ